MAKLIINLSQIEDQKVRDNFSNIDGFVNAQPLLMGEFALITGKITGTKTGVTFKHNLKFNPTDAILTSAIWSGAIGVLTFKNDLFTEKNIVVNTSGLTGSDSVDFKVLIGRIVA